MIICIILNIYLLGIQRERAMTKFIAGTLLNPKKDNP